MKIGPPITKRIHHLVLRVIDSLGGQYGPDPSNLEPFLYRELGDAMNTPPEMAGYDSAENDDEAEDIRVTFDGGYDRSGTILIYHDTPLPFTCLMIMAEMGVEQI